MNESPTVFISYAHDSEQHKADVLAFAELLYVNHVEVIIDRWFESERRDWHSWATKQIRNSDFVIVIASWGYRRASDGDVPPDTSWGVAHESALLRERLASNRAKWLPRILPVLLPGHSLHEIPDYLQPRTATRYTVRTLTQAGVESLIGMLTGRPLTPQRPRERRPPRPPKPRPTATPYSPPRWLKRIIDSSPPPPPLPDDPEPPTPEPAQPPAPAELEPNLTLRVREIQDLLRDNNVRAADERTTAVLLESAGRTRDGWLRESDGINLPEPLLSQLDSAWAKYSKHAWGFAAQRRRLAEFGRPDRPDFRFLSVQFGWREHENDVVPIYPEFLDKLRYDQPFFPTLRNPACESMPRWHDEWSATVRSVHIRLAQWGS